MIPSYIYLRIVCGVHVALAYIREWGIC